MTGVLARLLQVGTVIACALIALGGSLPSGGPALVKSGIVLFILLPVIRVAVMIAGFSQRRDWPFAAAAAAVLAIIALGITHS